MAAVTRGIDETSNLMAILGKHFIFTICFPLKVLFYLCICFFTCQSAFFISLFFSTEYFQWFSLNFARTLGHAQLTSC